VVRLLRPDQEILSGRADEPQTLARRANHRSACPALLTKIFRFSFHANHFYIHCHPVPLEGRIAIVTDVEAGCDGRGMSGAQ
jgi:hypothetical protein